MCILVMTQEEMLVMLPPVDFSGACAPDASGLLGSDPGGDGSKDGDSGGRTAWDADGGAGLDRMLQTRSEIGGFSRIAFCPGLAAWQVNTRENGTTSNRCADPAATLGGVMGGGGCHSSVSQESAKHGDQRSPSVHDAKEVFVLSLIPNLLLRQIFFKTRAHNRVFRFWFSS
jgi:hypothetical protein